MHVCHRITKMSRSERFHLLLWLHRRLHWSWRATNWLCTRIPWWSMILSRCTSAATTSPRKNALPVTALARCHISPLSPLWDRHLLFLSQVQILHPHLLHVVLLPNLLHHLLGLHHQVKLQVTYLLSKKACICIRSLMLFNHNILLVWLTNASCSLEQVAHLQVSIQLYTWIYKIFLGLEAGVHPQTGCFSEFPTRVGTQ